MLIELKNYTEAISNLTKTIPILEYHEEDSHIIAQYRKISEIYSRQNRNMLAVKNYQNAMSIIESRHGIQYSGLADIYEAVADTLVLDGQNLEAIKYYSCTMKNLAMNDGEDTPKMLEVLGKFKRLSAKVHESAYSMQKATVAMNGYREAKIDEDLIGSVIIACGGQENIRGVIEKVAKKMSLGDIRKRIAKECPQLKAKKFAFVRKNDRKSVKQDKESACMVEDYMISKDNYNYVFIYQRA